MNNQILEEILNSSKAHFTHSHKSFIKETYELLSIFNKQLCIIFEQEFKKITAIEDNKFKVGEKFFEYVQQLRYPISFPKLKKLKKINGFKKYLPNLTLEFDENILPKELQKELKEILNKL